MINHRISGYAVLFLLNWCQLGGMEKEQLSIVGKKYYQWCRLDGMGKEQQFSTIVEETCYQVYEIKEEDNIELSHSSSEKSCSRDDTPPSDPCFSPDMLLIVKFDEPKIKEPKRALGFPKIDRRRLRRKLAKFYLDPHTTELAMVPKKGLSVEEFKKKHHH